MERLREVLGFWLVVAPRAVRCARAYLRVGDGEGEHGNPYRMSGCVDVLFRGMALEVKTELTVVNLLIILNTLVVLDIALLIVPIIVILVTLITASVKEMWSSRGSSVQKQTLVPMQHE